LRFGVLRVKIDDISLRMLAETLRQLEQDGLLSRTVYSANPLRVEVLSALSLRSHVELAE
jgi:DNA-binding HxlR family transcriptional regulator